MLQYTQATLHTALTLWNVNSDPDFATTLPEIVRKGEILLSRTLDLDNLDSVNNAVSTAAAVATITKPATLINEREVSILAGGVQSTLVKRSRGWVDLYNGSGAAQGTPRFYCETNETTWTLAPIPLGVYPLRIQGNFTFASIEDGSSSTTTWFSTQVPDLLYYACSIEACEFLKNWNKKAQNSGDFAVRAKEFTGTARNLQRADIDDITGNRMSRNAPGTQEG